MSLNFCDLLVLGSDLSGIMTATLLAKRGMNVLVLDDDDDSEPMPNIATGLGSRSFKSLLGKLMIPDSKLQILTENKVGCQVVFPKHRLDVTKSRSLFLKEVEREFPQEKGLIEDFLDEINSLREQHLNEALSFFPIEGPKEKKRFVRWMESFPEAKLLEIWKQLSPTLQSFIRIQLRFFSRSPLFEPPILQLLLFFSPDSETSYSIKGGVRELKRLFFDKLDYFGGMVHPLGEESIQVLAKGREIKGVQLARYSFPTRCRFLLGNTNIQTIYNALPAPMLSFLFGRQQKKIAGLEPVEQRGVVQYQISRDILPTPMKENVIYVSDPSAPLSGANYLEINLHPLTRGGSSEEDTLMTVSYLQPAPPTAAGVEPLSYYKICDDVDARLHRLIPFSNGHLRRIFPAAANSPSGEMPELFPEQDDTALLTRLTRKRVSYAPSFFFPSLTSPYKNLFILGPNMLDWLGMEGKMISALRAVELIWGSEMKVRNP